MTNTTLQDIKSSSTFSISDYDCIILGSPLTAGRVHKKIRNFAVEHLEELKTKKIGLFVSGLQAAEYFEQNFPLELLVTAQAKAFLGGIFDPKKCGFIARTVIKTVAKLESYTSTIDEEKIRAFAKDLAWHEKANKVSIVGLFQCNGTCITSIASHYGVKTCDCHGDCSCPRNFADPLAKWGWDSYHERWFFGHTAYILSVHNTDLKLDLPIYMKFVEASRNDGVTLITALAHARFLYDDFLTFDSLLADAAHDNYPTYDLLKQWNIKPFIALNKRNSDIVELQNIQATNTGIPICADGHKMANWGFDAKRYRIKYRCPFVTGRVKYCPYSNNCNKTLYGKIVYVNLARDISLLNPVPRDSQEWIDTYKQRTASERVNNRILTDYKLEQPKRYGKKKIASFAFINAINVHLDAQIKFNNISIDSLIA